MRKIHMFCSGKVGTWTLRFPAKEKTLRRNKSTVR